NLERLRRARRHAARDRRAPLARDRAGLQGRRVRRPAGQDRRGCGVQHARAVRARHSRRPQAVERGRRRRWSEGAMSIRVAIPDLISPSYFPAIAAVEMGFLPGATLELLYPVTKTYEELREGRLDFVGGAAHAALYAFKDWQGG